MSSPSQIFNDTVFNSPEWDLWMDQLGQNELVCIDGLWQGSHLSLLQQYIVASEARFREAHIGKAEQTQHNSKIRSDRIFWLEENEDHPLIKETLQGLKRLQQKLSQSLRFHFESSEFHLAKYAPGAGYAAHIDQSPRVLPGESQRFLSLVIYLNPVWQPDWGGRLIIHNSSKKSTESPSPSRQEIQPLWNRTVIFLSQSVLHEVEMARHERLSLTGWLRK